MDRPVPAARAAGLEPTLDRRTLALKGMESPTEVFVLHVGATDAA